jgi:TRAP transporter TAXI family solute receptor
VRISFLKISILSLLILVSISFLSFAASETSFFKITSGGPGGVYFHHASALGQFIAENIEGINFSVDVSAGSVENVRRVGARESDFGLAFIYNASEAFEGIKEAGWEKAYSDVRGIAMYLWPVTNWVSLKKANIKTAEDLRGKRMSVGPPGSGSAVIAERMLKALGVWDDIKRVYLPFSDAAKALLDGQLDAFVGPGGYPAASLEEIATRHDMALVSLTDEDIAKCVEFLPGSVKGVLPAGAYRGIDEPVYQTVSPSLFIVHKDVPEEIVYRITSSFFTEEALKFAATIHKDWGQVIPVDQRVLEGMVIPLHKGAAKYWKEMGLTIPEEAMPID